MITRTRLKAVLFERTIVARRNGASVMLVDKTVVAHSSGMGVSIFALLLKMGSLRGDAPESLSRPSKVSIAVVSNIFRPNTRRVW